MALCDWLPLFIIMSSQFSRLQHESLIHYFLTSNTRQSGYLRLYLFMMDTLFFVGVANESDICFQFCGCVSGCRISGSCLAL